MFILQLVDGCAFACDGKGAFLIGRLRVEAVFFAVNTDYLEDIWSEGHRSLLLLNLYSRACGFEFGRIAWANKLAAVMTFY